MSAFRVERSAELSPEEKDFWAEALRERYFGSVTFPWTEAIRLSGPKSLEVHFLQVYGGSERCALAVLHILRRLDLGGYMGPAPKKFFSFVAKSGWQPMAADLAFLEVPLANACGIRFAQGAENQALEIATAVLEYVRREFSYGVLTLKASPIDAAESVFESLGLLKTRFLANTSLDIRGRKSFEDHVKTLDPRVRTQCRNYARAFAAAGGAIEVVEAFDDELFASMNRLYTRTLRHHAEHSNLQLPIPLNAEYFRTLLNSMSGACRVFVAMLHGEAVGFALVLDSGGDAHFTHCGLDYERTVPSRAYFNLYYAMIADSIARGVRTLHLGSEAYVVKKKLGAVVSPTVYYFEVRNPVLRAVASFVAKNFSSQDGANL